MQLTLMMNTILNSFLVKSKQLQMQIRAYFSLSILIISFPLFSLFFSTSSYANIASGNNADKSVPLAPTNLQVIETSFDFILLIWNDNSDNEAYFIVERHLEGQGYTPYDTLVGNTELYIDYLVEPATHYFYRILAYNLDGYSGYSNEVEAVTLSLPHTAPQPPSDVNAVFYNSNSVIVYWADNSDNELLFRLFRSQDSINFSMIDSVNFNTHQYSDFQIEADTRYYYYVVAVNDYGISSSSDTAMVDVTEIQLIDSIRLQISFTSYNSIGLKWNGSNLPDHSYSINRIVNESIEVVAENITDTLFADTNLAPNTTYGFQVIGIDPEGGQYFSNIVETYTLPWITQSRVNDSLIAIYFFANAESDSVPDLSWYKEPANLYIRDTAALNASSLTLKNTNLLIAEKMSSEKITQACKYTNEITVECWLKTSHLNEPVDATILSLQSDTGTSFSLGCRVDIADENNVMYYSNLNTLTTDIYGNPKLAIEGMLKTDVLQHIVFIHQSDGNEYIFINGSKAAEGFRPSKFDNWLESSNLVMANNLENNSPWLGSIYLCALYNKALTEDEIRQNYLASPFMEPDYSLNPDKIDISISPNPAGRNIEVILIQADSATDITERYYLKIFDINGFNVLEKNISDFFPDNYISIDISGLKQGMFTVILCNEHSVITWKKLLKID
jgi:hypothetical protein